jgi:hypothetical protein
LQGLICFEGAAWDGLPKAAAQRPQRELGRKGPKDYMSDSNLTRDTPANVHFSNTCMPNPLEAICDQYIPCPPLLRFPASWIWLQVRRLAHRRRVAKGGGGERTDNDTCLFSLVGLSCFARSKGLPFLGLFSSSSHHSTACIYCRPSPV